MKDRVLVVAPHPDDETLGCAGTLRRHKHTGDSIFWLIMTNIHVADGWSKEVIEQSQQEIAKVSDMFGFDKTIQFDYGTTKLDKVARGELVMNIKEIVGEIKPTIIYLPNRSDIHTDHHVTFQSVMSACKDFRVPFIRRIMMYECPSETEFSPALAENMFVPNIFVDVSEFFQKKLEIFQVYASEVMPSPLPRSIEVLTALGRLRGSRIGKEYAEAFCLLYEKVT